MKVLDIVNNISGILKQFTTVFFKERRKRARIQLDNLKDKLKDLESSPPNYARAKKYEKLNRKIKKLQKYLEN